MRAVSSRSHGPPALASGGRQLAGLFIRKKEVYEGGEEWIGRVS